MKNAKCYPTVTKLRAQRRRAEGGLRLQSLRRERPGLVVDLDHGDRDLVPQKDQGVGFRAHLLGPECGV